LDITITETGILTGSAKIAMVRAAIAFVARSDGAAPTKIKNLTAQHARTANSKLTMAMTYLFNLISTPAKMPAQLVLTEGIVHRAGGRHNERVEEQPKTCIARLVLTMIQH
jgi:hypothetical protein